MWQEEIEPGQGQEQEAAGENDLRSDTRASTPERFFLACHAVAVRANQLYEPRDWMPSPHPHNHSTGSSLVTSRLNQPSCLVGVAGRHDYRFLLR